MSEDPKRIVAQGYDRIGRRYLEWTNVGRPSPRNAYLERLLRLLPAGSRVLELGCGAGVPVTAALAAKAWVVGVDISLEQLRLAQTNVSGAALVRGDMAELSFPARSFDAVVAFYALTHVPRTDHADLLARVAQWLRPGGLFLATMGAADNPDSVEDDWLGAPMFFSHFDAEKNRSIVREAGFTLLEAAVVPEREDDRFLWVVAHKS